MSACGQNYGYQMDISTPERGYVAVWLEVYFSTSTSLFLMVSWNNIMVCGNNATRKTFKKTKDATTAGRQRQQCRPIMKMVAWVFWPSFLGGMGLWIFHSHQRMTDLNSLTTMKTTATVDLGKRNAPVNFDGFQTKLLESNPEELWSKLVQWGGQQQQQHSSSMSPTDNKTAASWVAMEVGMHSATQCIEAARAGLQAHCVEPSPPSITRMKHRIERLRRTEPEIGQRIHLHPNAAGAVSGDKVPFRGQGGTGDHVGEGLDVWTMTKTKTFTNATTTTTTPATAASSTTATTATYVETKRMDDIVLQQPHGVFVMKVDVQGYEPHVLQGLSESLSTHQVQYLLMEYWPKGIDFMMDQDETFQNKCHSSVKMLESLVQANYTLYIMKVLAHPDAGSEAIRATNVQDRPFESLRQHCLWYYHHELKSFPKKKDFDYKMGYWSDILAVSPQAPPLSLTLAPTGQEVTLP